MPGTYAPNAGIIEYGCVSRDLGTHDAQMKNSAHPTSDRLMPRPPYFGFQISIAHLPPKMKINFNRNFLFSLKHIDQT